MALGALKLNYISRPLGYENEATPLALTQKKMLPILEDKDGAINESLDIIKSLDSDSRLKLELLEDQAKLEKLEDLLSRLGKPIHNLCMPYWAYSKEFTSEAREYFINKKSVKRGPFSKLIQNKEDHLKVLAPLLSELESYLENEGNTFYQGDTKETPSIFDIMIASHIWGMYVFPEFQFSPKLHSYLQRVKSACDFEYHEDLWKDDEN